MPEPGRRIVEQELRQGGHALPWVDLAAFARRAIALAAADRAIPDDRGGRVFFDRGLVDAAVALQHAGVVDMAGYSRVNDSKDAKTTNSF